MAYGLYDFFAQILELPRFLDWLRNKSSFNITRAQGAQGWIGLPRIMSLAAEPSHTLMPIALTFFVASRLQGWQRIGLLSLAVLFTLGTFSRSCWIAYLGGAAAAAAASVLNKWDGDPRNSERLNYSMIALLPVIVLCTPFFTSDHSWSDTSFIERTDSSRAGVWLFLEEPLLGVGYFGWQGQTSRFSSLLMGLPDNISSLHNGVAVNLAAFGIGGAAIVLLPLVLVARARGLSVAEKSWWIAVTALGMLGGDYLSLPSTWTAIGIAITAARRSRAVV
jgi:hypothetical protein